MALTEEQQTLLAGLLELRHLEGKLKSKQQEKNDEIQAKNTLFKNALKAIDETFNPQITTLHDQVSAKKNELEAQAVAMGKPGFWAWLGF
jgi:hypothetical protein